jgi:hypothetical protein
VARRPIATTIKLDGPFFAPDRDRKFLANVHDLMAAIAEEGEADVRAQLQAGEGSRAPVRGVQPARVSGHIRGRVVSLQGKPWRYNAVVSPDTSNLSRKQAIAVMAAASRLESRTGAFKRTASRIRKAVASVDLTRGFGGS